MCYIKNCIITSAPGEEKGDHTMENRVTVSICGEEYTFVAEEAPSYMQKVGAYVGTKMDEMLTGAKEGWLHLLHWGMILPGPNGRRGSLCPFCSLVRVFFQ